MTTTTIERPAVGRLLYRVAIIQSVIFGLITLGGVWNAFAFGHGPADQLGGALGSLFFAVFVVAGVQVCRGRRTGVTVSKLGYVTWGLLAFLVGTKAVLMDHRDMLWVLPSLLWGAIFASPALYFHRSKQARALAGKGPVGEPRMAAANRPTPYTNRGWSGASKAGLLRAKGLLAVFLPEIPPPWEPFVCLLVLIGLGLALHFHTSQPAPPAEPVLRAPAKPVPPTIPPGIAVGKFAGRAAIYVRGTITKDENEDFVRAASALLKPLIVLSGPGGNLLAGIRIGEFVRAHGWDTAVPDGEACMSACALAWLGGVHRSMGTIGFHAAYRIKDGKAVEDGAANALVGAYLTKLGLAERAIIYITTPSPNEFRLLTLQDANTLGIRVAMMSGN